MRGISTAIILVLFLMLSVTIAYLMYVFFTGSFMRLSQAGSDSNDQNLLSLSSCIRVESASGSKLFVRNCGEGVVTQQSIGVYIDESYVSFTMSPASISESETGTVTLNDISGLNLGNHRLRVTSPKASSEISVEAYGAPISLRTVDDA
jgi:hypothetical protein